MVTSWYDQVCMTNGYDPFEEDEGDPDDWHDQRQFDRAVDELREEGKL